MILVTYTGQLHRVRDEMTRANLRLVVSDRDREQLDKAGLAADGGLGAKNGWMDTTCGGCAIEDVQGRVT